MNKNPDFNTILAAALAKQNHRMTNADRIRQMIDEELARWAWAVQALIECADICTTGDWLEWLRQEANDG